MTTTPTMLCLTEAVLVTLANFTASEMSAGEAWTYRPALKWWWPAAGCDRWRRGRGGWSMVGVSTCAWVVAPRRPPRPRTPTASADDVRLIRVPPARWRHRVNGRCPCRPRWRYCCLPWPAATGRPSSSRAGRTRRPGGLYRYCLAVHSTNRRRNLIWIIARIEV